MLLSYDFKTYTDCILYDVHVYVLCVVSAPKSICILTFVQNLLCYGCSTVFELYVTMIIRIQVYNFPIKLKCSILSIKYSFKHIIGLLANTHACCMRSYLHNKSNFNIDVYYSVYGICLRDTYLL